MIMAAETFADYLRRLIARKPVATLAQQSGVSEATIRAWLRGERRPEPDKLRAVAAVLKVDPEEFIRAAYAERPEPPILVPVFPHYISAGPGAMPEYTAYWPSSGERGHNFVAVPVSGDCMEPRIHEGETVVVDTDGSPRPGDIVAAEYRGERIVKLLEERGGRSYLVALQKEPPIEVTGDVTLLGVVVQIVRRP